MLMENNRTEFKQDLNDKLEKEVVAFLNNREGGVLYIGVDDNGKGIGVSNLDDTQLKMALQNWMRCQKINFQIT